MDERQKRQNGLGRLILEQSNMIEQNSKELLTKYRCRCDASHGITVVAVVSIVVALLLILRCVLFLNSETRHTPFNWCFIAIFGLMSVLLVIGGIACIRENLALRKFRFCMTEETVVSTRVVSKVYRKRRRIYFRVKFSRCEEFTLPEDNYTWSELSRITDVEMFNMIGIGDEFYVVVKPKQNKEGKWIPIAIYNKKFFEVSEKSFEKRDGVWYVK